MKFDSSARVEEIVWNMRLADLPRGANRAILNSLYNGDPPDTPDEAEKNNVQINRNWLEGTNLLSQARRQWNRAMFGGGNYFIVTLDSGPAHKRSEWGHTITRHLNRRLKRNRCMLEQQRATGATVMLHGIGPTTYEDRRSPYPTPLPISSLMIPSETDIDFKNLSYFAIYREYTPAQLYELTHGPKVDPGWSMPLVEQQLKVVAAETRKQPNATAYQYMPERIEELIKQDGGYWGSDAVPTIDAWDFYFREEEDGAGWYRRMILDWGTTLDDLDSGRDDRNQNGFIYTSKKRKYANSVSEILHCQFGDCSAVAPFKYHSVRSLGWMLWGVCDVQNRLRNRFMESAFGQLMWWFRTSSAGDMERIKKAMFTHMGVIPQGISFVPAQERFKPDAGLLEMAFAHNRQIMSENAASYTQDFDEGKSKGDMTATEVQARLSQVNSLVSGMLSLAYEQERFKDQEIARRFCIKHSPYPDARAFRLACLRDGVPPEMLDAERWVCEPERVLGGGNKAIELTQAAQLLQLRKNLGPDAQRRVDHIAIEIYTDDPAVAEELAPIEGQKHVSVSQHDAQLASERLLRGLPFTLPADAVFEDYAIVWLQDLAFTVQRAMQGGGMANAEAIGGMSNMAQQIRGVLQIMSSDDESKEKVRTYGNMLGQLENHIKAFGQRLMEQAKAQAQSNGNGEGAAVDAKTAATLKGKLLIDQAKAANMRESHAMRTSQKQVSFDRAEQQKEQKAKMELRRKAQETAVDLATKTATELHRSRLRTLSE